MSIATKSGKNVTKNSWSVASTAAGNARRITRGHDHRAGRIRRSRSALVCLWPEAADFGGQDMLDVFDLSFGDPPFEHREDGAGDGFGIDALAASELLCDPTEELLLTALSNRFSGRIPGVVVKAADEHRELCSELCDFLDRHPVAECVW